MKPQIAILTTGGTIDKVYFDANSEFQVGEPQIVEIFKESNINLDFELKPILRKDSLEITEEDRQQIREHVLSCSHNRILITHGTDTMADTARALMDIKNKVIVFTGSMEPAKLRYSDAFFNVGCAVTAVQTLPAGVYIAMNGTILPAKDAKKNRELRMFESDSPFQSSL